MNVVLRKKGLQIHPSPEGRIIAYINIEREDVFIVEEPWPTWINLFHWLTREEVVKRELLFREGEPYREQKIQETMRNLRNLAIFALVSIKAVKLPGSTKVGVVVHTRDLWSLRLENDVQITDWRFDRLFLQLTERNLFGRHKVASVRFSLFPFTYRIGEVYTDRRFLGHDFTLQESFDLIINRSSGNVEGNAGSFLFGRPFYDLSQRWSFDLQANYSVKVVREEKNGEVMAYEIEDSEDGGDVNNKPLRVYDDRAVSLRATGRYRHGNAYKQTFITGAGFQWRAVAPNSESNLAPSQETAFARDVMPKARRDVFPFIGYGLYVPRYVVLEDLATFGQSESIRIGPNVSMLMELPLRAFGSSTDSFLPYGELGYVWSQWRTLVEIAVSASARLEDGRIVDQVLSALTRGATPPFLIGRLVARLIWEARRADTSNTPISLGGNNGLRGYESKAIQFDGYDDLILGNLEFRTLPLKWESVHAGLVLFYDVGSVYRSFDEIKLYHAIGMGLRLLFPQFHRYVFRFDFGVPLNRSCCELLFTFGGAQAVRLTAAEDALVSAEE
ncbi:MAG: BamA/TamA family outer membrane protein [Deltaproteobacteria bacterium]|nr:BamA/TamA family outer membrane protein [Deltaproteobacteria bacterium]